MSAREKPSCQSARKWVADRLKHETGSAHPLAPLTGQDSRALSLFLHAVELYGGADVVGRKGARLAMLGALDAMQTKCWPIAKAAIPAILDWGDEDRIWGELSELRMFAASAAKEIARSASEDGDEPGPVLQ